MICGLVLAAGAGSRFGGSEGSKLLAPLDGRPLLEHAVRAQCAVPALQRVFVVLGAGASVVLDSVEWGRAEPVVCPSWQSGQSASLRCGLTTVFSAPGVEKAIVTLGDQPLVRSSVIARFVDEPCGTRAVYRGRPGHPVVLGPSEYRAVLSLTGDTGARDLLRGGRTIECSELCSGSDVDTPEDLEAIRNEARAVL